LKRSQNIDEIMKKYERPGRQDNFRATVPERYNERSFTPEYSRSQYPY